MKKSFQLIQPKYIDENAIHLIGDKWLLVTAGDGTRFNMMTASWGGMGYLWNKPVVFIFIRPQRYTYEFIEAHQTFTLSVFEEEYRHTLHVCGSLSGRDVNKLKESELTPHYTESGKVAFEEAYLILECKNLYSEFLAPEAFKENRILQEMYFAKDYHKMYIAEIVNAWEKR